MIYDGVINKPPIETLMHFNPNHDPTNGQFTYGPGGRSGSVSSKKKSQKQVSLKNTKLLTEKNLWENKERAIKAADLGLKALGEEVNDSNREWFLIEDQTIGLPTIADLVNQGYNKNQIQSLIKEAATAKVPKNIEEDGMFELLEGGEQLIYARKDFIDKCIEIYNNPKKPYKPKRREERMIM